MLLLLSRVLGGRLGTQWTMENTVLSLLARLVFVRLRSMSSMIFVLVLEELVHTEDQ